MGDFYIRLSNSDVDKILISYKGNGFISEDRILRLYVRLCEMEYRYIGNDSGRDWFASINDIAEVAGISNSSVIRGIKVLEEMGLLRVIRQKYSKDKGKRLEENRYKILGSTMNHGDEEEERTQAAEKPRVKKLKEQPEQVNKAIETKVESKKDSHSNPNPPETNKAIENDLTPSDTTDTDIPSDNITTEEDNDMGNCYGTIDQLKADNEPRDITEKLYLSAARKLKANGLTREITQKIKAKVKPYMGIKQRMEFVRDKLHPYSKGLTNDEYIIATERISSAAYEEAVAMSEQNRKTNSTLEELSAPDFDVVEEGRPEVNDVVADFQIQEMEKRFSEAVA